MFLQGHLISNSSNSVQADRSTEDQISLYELVLCTTCNELVMITEVDVLVLHGYEQAPNSLFGCQQFKLDDSDVSVCIRVCRIDHHQNVLHVPPIDIDETRPEFCFCGRTQCCQYTSSEMRRSVVHITTKAESSASCWSLHTGGEQDQHPAFQHPPPDSLGCSKNPQPTSFLP